VNSALSFVNDEKVIGKKLTKTNESPIKGKIVVNK
jgi:hypothetical protein